MKDISQKPQKVVYISGQKGRKPNEILELLFREHEAALRSFLRVRVISKEDVEDVMQDVYIRLTKVDDLIEKVNRRNGSTRSYIFSIANNLVIDNARRQAVRRKYASEVQEGIHDTTFTDVAPETYAIAEQELERIKAIIMELSPKPRRAFLLSRFKYMSYGQIAEEMDVPVKRVEKYISKALSALKKGIG